MAQKSENETKLAKVEAAEISDAEACEAGDKIACVKGYLNQRYADKHPFFKWFRRLFMVFLILPLLIFLGFWGAMHFVDFNQYKPAIEKEFFDRTGQKLEISGDVKVSVIPFVLSIHELNIKNPEGFAAKDDLAQIQAVEMELSLWDLFIHRHLSIKGLEVERPVINLITNAQGKTNWHYFQKIAGLEMKSIRQDYRNVAYISEANAKLLHVVDVPSVQKTTHRWQLKTLISQNAKINWIDERAKKSYRLRDFDVMAFDVQPDHLINLIAEFDYASGQSPAKFHVKLTQKLKISADLSDWQFSDWQGNVVMRLPRDMKVPLVQMETSGKLLAWNQMTKQLSVRDATLSSLESFIKLNMTGNYGDSPYMKGQLTSKNIQLKKWLRHAGIALPDFVDKNALTKLSLSLDWEQTPEQLMVDNLDMNLDGSQIKGKLFTRVQAGNNVPELHFDLAVKDLNLEAYRAYKDKPSKAVEKKATDVPADKAASTSTEQQSAQSPTKETFLPIGLPVKTLKKLHAEGQLTFKNFQSWGLKFDQGNLTLLADKGRIDIAPLDADMYQGHLSSKLMINVDSKTPSYEWSGKMEQVALKPFLTDGWHYSDLSGDFNTWFDFQTQGVNAYLLRQNMNGHLETRVTSGSVTGFDLNKLLAGEGSKPADKTQFDKLTFEGEIKKGTLDFKKCNLNSERFSSICVGQLNLPKGQIGAKLFTTYQKPPGNLSSLKGIEVPVVLKGPLNQIQWSVDMKRLLNSPANQQKLLNGLQQLFAK